MKIKSHALCLFLISLLAVTNAVTLAVLLRPQKNQPLPAPRSPGVEAAEKMVQYQSAMDRQLEDLNSKAEETAAEFRKSAENAYQVLHAEALKTGQVFQEQAGEVLGRIQEEMRKFNETLEEQRRREGKP